MYSIRQQLEQAQRIAAPYWPLNAFIATNHLWGFRQQNFFDLHKELLAEYLPEPSLLKAMLNNGRARRRLSKTPSFSPVKLYAMQVTEYEYRPLAQWISERIYTVLRDYFANNQTASLLQCWANIDNKNAATIIDLKQTDHCIQRYLQSIKVPESLVLPYLKTIYLQVYGWTSLSLWLQQQNDNPWINKQPIHDEIALMWLFYEQLAMGQIKQPYLAPKSIHKKPAFAGDHRRTLQIALEQSVVDPIAQQFNRTPPPKQQADAQLVFCIDTRSEGLRRHLEQQGNYQTFGAAGFFGTVFKLDDQSNMALQSPAIVAAAKTVVRKRTLTEKSRVLKALKHMNKQAKNTHASPLAWFEISGIWYSLYMLFKSLFTRTKLEHCSHKPEFDSSDFNAEEKTAAASEFLQSIDLTDNFANEVVVCGHQTDITNNPFQSALNCGACGGNSGVANATVMCDFINDKAVRKLLRDQHNIDIPTTTRFIAAVHHTVDDRIEYLDGECNPTLAKDLQQACQQLKQEKINDMTMLKGIEHNERDWAQLIPELGLINNACFIIGPRWLTQHSDCKRRAFLHSYNPDKDPDASILTGIFSGPCIVANWINMQYFLSSANPNLFGAGNKAIHNPIAQVGVLEGNLSDLKIGLPLQSTHYRSELIHQPVRLTIFVYASSEQIQTAINATPDLKALVDNEWVILKPIKGETHAANHSH